MKYQNLLNEAYTNCLKYIIAFSLATTTRTKTLSAITLALNWCSSWSWSNLPHHANQWKNHENLTHIKLLSNENFSPRRGQVKLPSSPLVCHDSKTIRLTKLAPGCDTALSILKFFNTSEPGTFYNGNAIVDVIVNEQEQENGRWAPASQLPPRCIRKKTIIKTQDNQTKLKTKEIIKLNSANNTNIVVTVCAQTIQMPSSKSEAKSDTKTHMNESQTL